MSTFSPPLASVFGYLSEVSEGSLPHGLPELLALPTPFTPIPGMKCTTHHQVTTPIPLQSKTLCETNSPYGRPNIHFPKSGRSLRPIAALLF
ncbi:hypothetical protein RSAG8_13835, partial [Rhizoctonia solani AG-8 WAC10335]